MMANIANTSFSGRASGTSKLFIPYKSDRDLRLRENWLAIENWANNVFPPSPSAGDVLTNVDDSSSEWKAATSQVISGKAVALAGDDVTVPWAKYQGAGEFGTAMEYLRGNASAGDSLTLFIVGNITSDSISGDFEIPASTTFNMMGLGYPHFPVGTSGLSFIEPSSGRASAINVAGISFESGSVSSEIALSAFQFCTLRSTTIKIVTTSGGSSGTECFVLKNTWRTNVSSDSLHFVTLDADSSYNYVADNTFVCYSGQTPIVDDGTDNVTTPNTTVTKT